MITFFIGLALLLLGGFFYGKFCEKLIKPDKEKQTPAYELKDGVDFVPMSKLKNALIHLLNIAGTGPILGAVQGILFGPVAFITIPIGCVIGGAMHDYMSGMIAVRNNGKQMPALVNKYLGKANYILYIVLVCVLMVLVGTVFIYTPGDLFVGQVIKGDTSVSNPVVWIVFGVIFIYYFIATLFPIDKIIGKVYPIFGGLLILATAGVFVSLLFKGWHFDEIWSKSLFTSHPNGLKFIPVFFVTVACGIVSGFHSTQAAMLSRTLRNEKDGRTVFYNMMIAEGFIAMVWSAAAMGIFNSGLSTSTGAVAVVGEIAKALLGNVGGIIAIISVMVLAITSGDTALRSLRLMAGDFLKLDQTKKRNRSILSLCIFALVLGLLIFAKLEPNGFNVLWRYFAWANQTIALFAFAMITVYLLGRKSRFFFISLIPGMFYAFIISSFLLNANIGFNLPWLWSYIIGAVFTCAYGTLTVLCGLKRAKAHSVINA